MTYREAPALPPHAPTVLLSDADSLELSIRANMRAGRVERAANWLLTNIEREGFPQFASKGKLVALRVRAPDGAPRPHGARRRRARDSARRKVVRGGGGDGGAA